MLLRIETVMAVAISPLRAEEKQVISANELVF